jgi:pyruvate formate lyase activating enzyme
LDTNGSRPEVLAALIKAGLVDRLAVDVKAVPGRYPAALCAAGSAEGVGLTAAIAIELHRTGRLIAEFRTTCYAPVVDEGVIMEIARVLSGPVPWYLQACRPERVLSPKALAAAGPQPGKEVLAGWAAAASSLLPCSVR